MEKLKKLLSKEAINLDLGLLILRLGFGLSMAIFHGYGKITGGPERWERIGSAMANMGVSFLPTFWGFMAAFSEFFGSIFLVLGILFRPSALLLAFTMFIAMLNHLNMPPDSANAGFSGASHAIELMVVYVALLYLGSGKFTVTSKL